MNPHSDGHPHKAFAATVKEALLHAKIPIRASGHIAGLGALVTPTKEGASVNAGWPCDDNRCSLATCRVALEDAGFELVASRDRIVVLAGGKR